MRRRIQRPEILLFSILACLGSPSPSARGQEPSQAESLSKAFRSASKRVLPAVVGVRPVVPERPTASPSVAETGRLTLPDAQGGSGFLIDAVKGWVLTNDHVVRGAAKVVVILNGGREREAREIRRDPKSDLALLVIDPKGLPPAIVWGDSEALDTGDWVLAIGQPFGLSDTVTAGIVSGKGRGIGIALYEDLIQTDAAINPGNSGGPLVNLKGEVVGINTAIKTLNGRYEGVGFAVPAARARRVAGDLAEFGRVRRAYLGLDVRRVPPEVAERLDGAGAALITSIAPDGPAAEAGLRPGDILLKLGGEPIKGPGALQAAIEVADVGKPLRLTVDRGGSAKDVSVLPRSQPDRFGLPQDNP